MTTFTGDCVSDIEIKTIMKVTILQRLLLIPCCACFALALAQDHISSAACHCRASFPNKVLPVSNRVSLYMG